MNVAEMQSEEFLEMRPRNDNSSDAPAGTRKIDSTVCLLHWYACVTMAKAKRRKLRARRSKANHGRKPNAGRG